MIGVGRTVFQGADLADFKVHIIGVLRNVQGPRRNLILARLEGGPLAQTGVAAGMSGSPVYVDGRLTWPSERYAAEYGPRSALPDRWPDPLPADAARRRLLVDLPEER